MYRAWSSAPPLIAWPYRWTPTASFTGRRRRADRSPGQMEASATTTKGQRALLPAGCAVRPDQSVIRASAPVPRAAWALRLDLLRGRRARSLPVLPAAQGPPAHRALLLGLPPCLLRGQVPPPSCGPHDLTGSSTPQQMRRLAGRLGGPVPGRVDPGLPQP